MDYKILIFLLLVALTCTSSSNILIVVPYAIYSHYIMFKPLGFELAQRGHNVTIITAFKEVDHPPNYHQVMADLANIWQITGTNLSDAANLSAEQLHTKLVWPGGIALTEIFLNSSEVAQFISKDHHFDVIVMEHFLQEALYVLAHKYNAPLVLITTYGNCGKQNIITRNPLQLGSLVSEYLDVNEPSSFMGILRNVYFTIYEYYWWKNLFLVQQEELVKKYFSDLPEPVPSLYELQKNAAVFMINSHFSFDPPTAYLPNIVEIGGVQITDTVVGLPENLQDILDRSINGVVYVNFGSVLQSSRLPVEKRNALLNVFKRLNQTVLWKWEDDSLLDFPPNVVLQKWMPQKEILSHPNTKVFISHGGLMGTQEAVYHGVPIIGVPMFADQFGNVIQIQDAGNGRLLSFFDINEENLESVLHELLFNDSYMKRAKILSQRFKDRPKSALDLVIFWIEYVIKNKGAECLKHPGLNVTWIEYNMLDVYAFVLFVLLIFIFISYKILAMLFRTIFKLILIKMRL